MASRILGGSGRSFDSYDVAVVGAGQAGLALGYFLTHQGRNSVILEAADEPAASWRARWDSLKLFTSVRYNGLPGLDFRGEPRSYPGRDDVVAYLTDYARRFELPVALNSRVGSLWQGNGRYQLEADGRTDTAEQVVIATRPFQVPFVPAIADGLAPEVVQLHGTEYRNPNAVPEGAVLIVGGGNTGFQIAEELLRTHEVHLSIGSRQTPLPQRIFGRDLFWYLEATGLIRKSTETRMGRRLAGRDTLIGSHPRSLRRRHGVHLHKRAVAAAGRTVRFADGEALDVSTVIWATGFSYDHSCIKVPVFDEQGRVVHRRGVTESPGLYFLGLTWQYTRGSALLGWVGEDTSYIAERIEAFRATGTPSARKEPVRAQ
jgi:putative flavoprotein involved in K+ transport